MIRFDVENYVVRKGGEWLASLSEEERDGISVRLESLALGVKPGGAGAVADTLAGRFHDNRVMQKVLLETMARFGKFSEFMGDVRLRDGNTVLDVGIEHHARDHYNTALALTLGISDVAALQEGVDVATRRERFFDFRSSATEAAPPGAARSLRSREEGESPTTSDQVGAQAARRMSAIQEESPREIKGDWTHAAITGQLGKDRAGFGNRANT